MTENAAAIFSTNKQPFELRKYPALAGSFSNSDTKSSDPSTSDFKNAKRRSKLDPKKRKLLMSHNGCFKCRCFNRSHGINNCPNDFPNGRTYKKITTLYDAAGNAPTKEGKPSFAGKAKAVAAITTDEATFHLEEGKFYFRRHAQKCSGTGRSLRAT